MRTTRLTVGAVAAAGVCLLLSAGPAWAHHAFAAEFDANLPIRLQATVAKVEWINPHSWIHVDVKNDDGEVERWMVEGGNPSALLRRGFTRKSLPVGTEIIVEGYRAKGNPFRANAGANRDLRLVEAAKEGNGDAVRGLLRQQVDVNARDPDGSTALLWAAYRGDLDVAGLLIAAGADPNAANDYGETPLSLACQNRNMPLAQELLSAGANPNAAKRNGETVLMSAARTGNSDVVELLIARGANVNAREMTKGQTALMSAVARKHLLVAEVLIAAQADVNASSQSGSTALHFAVQQGSVQAAKLLLSANADPDAVMRVRQIDQEVQPFVETVEGVTPLLLAITICRAGVPELAHTTERPSSFYACSANEEIGAILLDHGANPNAPDGNGIPALHHAVHARMVNLVRSLLAHGGNPNAQVPMAARQWEGDEVVGGRGFFPLPVGATPFFVAARIRDTELMRALLAAGADANIAADDKTAPLMAAVGVGARRSPTARDKAIEPETQDALEAVKFVLEQGADVNVVNAFGQTAMHGAATIGANEFIRLLVDRGAKVDVKDKDGQTPLAVAERNKDHSTVELLTKLIHMQSMPQPK